MENSWQRKCSTMWQSTVAPVLSSSLEPQNGILNAGYHFYSCMQAKPTSSAHRMAPESLLPWISSMSSNNSDHAELGSSLLPLISGPQCITPPEVVGCNVSGFAAGNEFSVLASGIVSQNLNSLNVEAGSDPCSVLSSKARGSANHGSKSGPSNVLQDAYISLEKLELPKAGMHQNIFSNETEVLFPSLRVGCVNGSIPSNAWKIPNGHNTGALHKPDPSVSCSSSTITTGCPRVFCLNLCGDLLLSNTGLLGVVCSCHGIHMSITKFSEHSGLCNTNPGVAVCLDSGETIAHWRKAYFHKYGIKIPEDHCGWDWPEGSSVPTGLMKHCPIVPGVSKSSDRCSHDGSLASVQSFNLRNSTVYPTNFHMVQKLPVQFAHDEKHRNANECVSSSSKNNMHSTAKNQKMVYSTSESSTRSNLVGVNGPDNVFQSLPPSILPISKSGDPFVLHAHLQNLETVDKDIDIWRNSGSSVQRDKVSSNVELRLGQPSEQGQSSGGPIQLAFGSHMIRQPHNTFFLEQHVPRSYSKSVEDKRQLNYLDNSVPSFEQVKGDAAGGSLISGSVAHLKYPLEGRIRSTPMKDVIRSSHVLLSKVHSESPYAKPSQFGFPLVGGEASQRGFISNPSDSQKHKNRENGPSAIDNIQGAAELSSCSHSKSKGRIWSGGESGSDHKVYPAGKDESITMCHFSGGTTDEPVRGNTLNYFGQAFYPVQNGELVFSASRSLNSPMDFRRVLSTQVVPVEFSATNSLGNQSLSPFPKKENIGGGLNLMHSNVRIHSVPHMSDLPNENHPTTSFKAIPEQDIGNFCGKSQVEISSLASDKRTNEINYVSMLKTSDVARQSFRSADFLSSDNTKLPSVTEKVCNLSVTSQGRYCHGKDAEIQNQFTPDMQSTRQLILRLGGTESISPSSGAGKCPLGTAVGYPPSKYSFSVQTNSLTGIYNEKGETVLPECKHEGNAGNMMATLLGQKFGKSSTKVDSFGHNGNRKQNTKKIECNSFLWRDVPRKVVEKCSLACVENSTDSSNGNVVHKPRKWFDETANSVGLSKQLEMSNVSSGCSAPVVTQASMEINAKDSSTVDAEDVGYEGNAIVDEVSGIERCWSSDDGVDSERNVKFSVFDSELNLGHKRTSKPLLSKPNSTFIDELMFGDSLRRKMQKQSHISNCNQEKGTLVQKSERDCKIWKRRPVKWKKLTSSFSPSTVSVVHSNTSECAANGELHSSSVKDMKMQTPCDQGKFEACPCSVGQNIKRKSKLSLSTDISVDRDAFRIHHVEEEKTDREMNLNANSDNTEAMGRKRVRLSGANQALKQIHMHRSNCVDMEVTVKETLINCHTCSQAANISQKPRRPIVCGKYGVIANADSLKPVKFVSLRKLLKAPSKCRLPDTSKVDLSSGELSKKAAIKGKNGPFYESSKIKEEVNGKLHHAIQDELNPQHCMDEMETECSIGSKKYDNLSHVMKRRRCHGNKIEATADGCQIIELRQRSKEVRKRSLHELTTKENHSSYMKFPILKNVDTISQTKSVFLYKLAAEADNRSANDKISPKDDKCQHASDLDVICCVCGSSSKDENDDLLECSGCLIKVHQACYGISRVPKAHWYCRSCKTSSKNIQGLPQSEVEGDDNESIGFYGRCLLHAMNHHFEPDSYHLDSGDADDGQKKLTCARTEGYKGRKRDGVHYNLPPKSDGCGGSLFVPQEQVDAWIHINRQKPRRKGSPKLSSSESEHDCRKEYARYKQSRGWEHLVVYKSVIHGLGLYTSQFISRGSMVVEYVGEIVGLRVTDKREAEYQSGKKLQDKSACYFFKIDKEYVIDATRKGGIARFVNHSCQPNCVAEIISVRNEKKVVFFAERDIYPGEEITYDYHFNHEDEGKKIPCYCNSKNCRRYLN